MCVVAAVTILATGSFASAQDAALTPLQIAVACAPPTSLAVPDRAASVIGAQDTVARTLFDEHDMLIVNRGTRDGMRAGQEFFVRRPLNSGISDFKTRSIQTLAWIRVVAAADATAVAQVEHLCGAILQGDYLEPFTAPTVPLNVNLEQPSGTLDFAALGRVLFGVEDHALGGAPDLMMIDRGSDQGVAAGARFAVYRDVHADGVPLAQVGELVIVSTGQTMALARITRSRDAVVSGDYVVPRK
jgi:hypothetical protein